MDTLESASFQFFTFTGTGAPIDVYTQGTTIKMLQNAKLQTVQVSLESYDNSAVTNYTFTFVPSVPIVQSDTLLITFPIQIGLPANSTSLGCFSPLDKLLAAADCTFDPTTANTVRVVLRLAAGIKSISPMDRFALTVQNVRNP